MTKLEKIEGLKKAIETYDILIKPEKEVVDKVNVWCSRTDHAWKTLNMLQSQRQTAVDLLKKLSA